ncbi:hypothetical protein PF008_g19366 [Phytophthora fragariae]|uniref:C2H2-type domain-containing protein n=1 Tax=Phytophthora fragariae TaxID=53985 RepID=A0A6G0R2W1_9STRA|nr:hypothetical protein PF008_g19366 [Phytophthora fragariae]
MSAVTDDDAVEILLKCFWEDGYMIMPKVFAAEIITTVRAKIKADDETKTLDFVSIFKEVGSNTFDEFRKMAPLNRKAYKKLKDEATLLIKKFHVRWQPTEWVALESLSGGEEQDPHRHIPAVEIGKARKNFYEIQAGLIIGLSENAKLVLYPKCFAVADPRSRTEVLLGSGDCVIFRRDVIHSGAAFTEPNYRIHCVLTIKGIKWGADATEFALPPAYKCELCPFMAPTKLQVSNHKRGCLRNPARAANRARDLELNEKGKFCCVCKKQFAKRNTYYKHFNRRHKPYLKL